MEAFIRDQIIAVLKYVPFHIAASYVKKRSSPAVEEARRKLGGFVKGICHPTENYAQIKGAGLEWNRADIPFPFEKDGSLRQCYLDWKEKMRRYQENGIRILAVTPYPSAYIGYGADPRTPEGEQRVREIAVFMLNDLKGIAEAYQITNEMGIPHFTNPLNMKQAARFIGVQLEAMYPGRGNALLGYNSSGPQGDLHALLRPWHQFCDYVGIDLYIGCFAPVGNSFSTLDMMLRYIWSMTNKPIILCEFGYLSEGAPKSKAEKQAILQRYGVNSEKEIKEKIGVVLEHMKELAPTFYRRIINNADTPAKQAGYLLQIDTKNHLYYELPKGVKVHKCPHTPEGQANFYRTVLPRLAKHPYLLGAFIYAWQDSERCYACGQAECPTETRWGLVDRDDKEKPGYYAVRDALAGIK